MPLRRDRRPDASETGRKSAIQDADAESPVPIGLQTIHRSDHPDLLPAIAAQAHARCANATVLVSEPRREASA